MGEHKQATALERTLWEVRRGLAAVAAISLFLNLLVLVSPLYTFQVFDRALASAHLETLVALTLAAGFACSSPARTGCAGTRRWSASAPGSIGACRSRCSRRAWGKRSPGARSVFSRCAMSPAARLPQQRERVSGARRALDVGFLAVLCCCTRGSACWRSSAPRFCSRSRWPAKSPCARRCRGQRAWMAAQQTGETALRNAEAVHAMGMLPALLRRWQATRARPPVARAGGRPGAVRVGVAKFVRLSFRSPSSASARTWCWTASLPPAA